ncbi:hypothetical protein IEQ34_016215 [Dendrobium chrysotoxum]|uniref:Uncharacterized protein n=1 Tax=Dendrobium chrysotoxum TaxID=161865 RepID=A0AAV7GCV9_DENCH|nr:hypothetical protein IEQ34_016215 [Dendrobium chrysotoxum]
MTQLDFLFQQPQTSMGLHKKRESMCKKKNHRSKGGIGEDLQDGMQTPGNAYPLKENTWKVTPTSLKKELRPLLKRVEAKNNIDFRRETSHSDKSPDEARSITGSATTHWNDEEHSSISPKQ